MTHLEVNHDGYPTHCRKVRFDWSNTPLHWVPGDPSATHMLNVFHLMLPVSERWFIKAIIEAEPLVDDAELRAAIKPLSNRRPGMQGIDTTPYTDRLQTWLSKLGKQHPDSRQ
jgi:predicted metal-dependent hydrolase